MVITKSYFQLWTRKKKLEGDSPEVVGISEGKSHIIIWNGGININIYIFNIIYSILIKLIWRKTDKANQYHYTYSFMFCRKNYSCTYCKNTYINSLHLSSYFLLYRDIELKLMALRHLIWKWLDTCNRQYTNALYIFRISVGSDKNESCE